MKMKFMRCTVCGQIVAFVEETGVPLICCGKAMKELLPGTVDASKEKHVPIVEINENTILVKIGSEPHHMESTHYIEWVSLQTKLGNQRKSLSPGMKPEVCFALCPGDSVEAVYAYCNLHSLWKA